MVYTFENVGHGWLCMCTNVLDKTTFGWENCPTYHRTKQSRLVPRNIDKSKVKA